RNGDPPSSSPSTKETLWQKASSLRQSLRGRTRHDSSSATPTTPSCRLGRPASLYLVDSSSSASRTAKSRQSLRREWGSQRDLSRDKRHGPSQADTACVPTSSGDVDKAWSSTWTIPDAPPPPKQRSPRKLTKDSGYETSGGNHGEPDYVNREWVAAAPGSAGSAAAGSVASTTSSASVCASSSLPGAASGPCPGPGNAT
ncbi:unnamed protein product, partial [Ixodes hexagonus]